MNIALCQMEVVPGRPELNLRTIKDFLARARDAGAGLVAFPELCVSGYLLGDLWTDQIFTSELAAINDELATLSDDATVLIWGNVSKDAGGASPLGRPSVNHDGRPRLYNSVFVAHQGRLAPRPNCILPPGTSHKTLLPNYRFFDDNRYFYSLHDLAIEQAIPLEELLLPWDITLGSEHIRLGVEVCEDLWFGDYLAGGEPLNVSAILAKAGADVLVNVSASPWTMGKNTSRHRRVREALAQSPGVRAFAYVNCTGVQNNGKNFITFEGGSTLYGPTGTVHQSFDTPHQPGLLCLEMDLGTHPVPRIIQDQNPSPGSGQTDPYEAPRAQFQAAIAALRSLDKLMGSSTWPMIIGLSGGIDSAVNACLLEQAYGPDRVKAFNLPSAYNSQSTIGAAKHIAQELGVSLTSIGIGELADLTASTLAPWKPSVLNLENIQAKTRGTVILSNLAGILGGLMCNNGNKVELALGYATLYGDVNGAIAPLGDLLKTEVFALAHFLNHNIYGRQVIPQALLPDENFSFGIAPSAELKDAQVDPMKWGYHDAIIGRLMTYRRISQADLAQWWLEGRLHTELGINISLLETYGLIDGQAFIDDLTWLFRLLNLGVYKRIQAPPIIVMSRSSFGYDYRESQLSREPGPTWTRLCKDIVAASRYQARS